MTKISTERTGIRSILESITDSIPVNVIETLESDEKEQLSLFSSITGTPLEPSETIRSLAALLVLNRIKFVSQHEQASDFSNCSICVISNLLTDKHPRVFVPTILETIANQGKFTITEALINRVKALSEQSTDMIPSLYLQVLEQSTRRKLGQFWTPKHISEFMVELLLEHKPKNILDPCAGPGTFINSIERMEPEFPGEIMAFEIHPLLYEILNVNLYSSHFDLKTRYGDFLTLNNNGTLEKTDHEVISSRRFESIICNPPYSRHHVLSRDTKEKIGKEFEQAFGGRFNRISSLFMYFILRSLQIISSNGRLVFITPTIIFESKYSSYLKKILKDRFTIPLIIVFHHSLNIFPEVDTAACIFVVESRKPEPLDVTKLVIVEKWTSKESLLENINKPVIDDISWENGNIFAKKQAELDHESNWTSPRTFSYLEKHEKLTELSCYFTAMRGIATGKNDYFVLTDRELEQHGIKHVHFVPTITKTRQVQQYLFSEDDFNRLKKENRKIWLLYVQKKIEDIVDKDLLNYLEHGLELGVHQGSLVKSRKYWHMIEKRNLPVFFYTYLSRGNPRFILNEAGVRPLNVFLLIYPKDNEMMSDDIKELFWVILNSNFTVNSLRDVGRCYGGDTLKIEPREMEKALILDPFKISVNSKTALLKLAAKLRKITTSNNKEVLAEIDEIIEKELESKVS